MSDDPAARTQIQRTEAHRAEARRGETHEPLDRVLDQRRARSGTARRLWGGTGAALLHGVVIGGAILGPQLFAKPPKPIEFVPVQLVPAPARGAERPAPPAPQPVPSAAPEPVAEPEPSAAPAPTTAPEPEPTKPPDKPSTTAATASPTATPPPAPPTGPPGREGTPTGRADSPFTATVGGVDNPNFTYGYYLDRMILLIRAKWTRPPLGSGVVTTLHFRILSDGTVEAIELVDSSGYNSFDLAALRALQEAAPLPPLPRSFREGELGVTITFH